MQFCPNADDFADPIFDGKLGYLLQVCDGTLAVLQRLLPFLQVDASIHGVVESFDHQVVVGVQVALLQGQALLAQLQDLLPMWCHKRLRPSF